MSHIEHHLAPPGMTPGNGYSHTVSASGRLVAIAGQVAMDEHGELFGPGDPVAQTERVFQEPGAGPRGGRRHVRGHSSSSACS